MTFGERLVAQRDAEWFCNPDEADARARALSGSGKSAVVVEVPHGNFGVVEVNDVGGDNARQPTPDQGDSESDDVYRRLPGALGSVRFFLRAGGNVHLTASPLPRQPPQGLVADQLCSARAPFAG